MPKPKDNKAKVLSAAEKYISSIDWKEVSKKLQSLSKEAGALARRGKQEYGKLDARKKKVLAGAAALIGVFAAARMVSKRRHAKKID